MTPTEARKLWAEALRSGEFKQGSHGLHVPTLTDCDDSDDSYCCLGVACEVYQRHVGDLTITRSSEGGMKKYDGEFLVLPEKVAKWLDITSAGAPANEDDSVLVTKNDVFRWSFSQIADAIEQGGLKPYADG